MRAKNFEPSLEPLLDQISSISVRSFRVRSLTWFSFDEISKMLSSLNLGIIFCHVKVDVTQSWFRPQCGIGLVFDLLSHSGKPKLLIVKC